MEAAFQTRLAQHELEKLARSHYQLCLKSKQSRERLPGLAIFENGINSPALFYAEQTEDNDMSTS